MEEARRGWRAGGPCRERGDERKKRGGEEGAAAVRKLQGSIGGMDKNDGGRRRGTSKWSELYNQREPGQANEKPQQHMLGAPAVSISSILAGCAGEHKGSLCLREEASGLQTYKQHRIKLPASRCQGAWKV